jgi:hypothetical protein
MLDKVIATAIKLWLRSQVETVEDLNITLVGGDRQILQGYLPQIALTSSSSIYQGLYLRHIDLKATNIRFNLPEVLKGKSLKLLDPIPVVTAISLTAEDLQASLGSPLLSSALTDLYKNLIVSSDSRSHLDLNWQTIGLAEQKLTLRGTIESTEIQTTQIEIIAGLTLANSHTLLLSPIAITTNPHLSIEPLAAWKIDLGDLVRIDELSIDSQTLCCSGQITIIP